MLLIVFNPESLLKRSETTQFSWIISVGHYSYMYLDRINPHSSVLAPLYDEIIQHIELSFVHAIPQTQICTGCLLTPIIEIVYVQCVRIEKIGTVSSVLLAHSSWYLRMYIIYSSSRKLRQCSSEEFTKS